MFIDQRMNQSIELNLLLISNWTNQILNIQSNQKND